MFPFADATRRNVPPIILGESSPFYRPRDADNFSFPRLIPTTSMLTESFPCMILHRRNLSCIGCGCPRSANSNSSAQQFGNPSNPRAAPSPRFNSQPSSNVTYYSSSLPPHQPSPQPSYISHSQQSHSPRYSVSPVQPHASQPPKSSHPLLTPSGRAFAVGGKVQNVSSDPLSPCIMYWPDNEPFPEQGQIRPSGLVGVPVSIAITL